MWCDVRSSMKYEELCLCTWMCRDSCNLNRIGRGMKLKLKLKLVAMQSRSGLICNCNCTKIDCCGYYTVRLFVSSFFWTCHQKYSLLFQFSNRLVRYCPLAIFDVLDWYTFSKSESRALKRPFEKLNCVSKFFLILFLFTLHIEHDAKFNSWKDCICICIQFGFSFTNDQSSEMYECTRTCTRSIANTL